MTDSPTKPTYYQAHRQEILARAKARYADDAAHRERVRTRARAHYAAHRPEILARQKAAYAEDPATFIARCQGSTRAEVEARRKARRSAAPLAGARYRLSAGRRLGPVVPFAQSVGGRPPRAEGPVRQTNKKPAFYRAAEESTWSIERPLSGISRSWNGSTARPGSPLAGAGSRSGSRAQPGASKPAKVAT